MPGLCEAPRFGMLAAMRVLAALIVVGIAVPSSAQRRDIDPERFRPALDAEGFLGVNATATPGPWRWNVGLWMNYTKGSLTGATPEGTRDVIRHRFGGDLQMQLGLGGRFALALDLPIVFYQNTRTDALGDGGPTLQSSGFGDLRVSGRVRLYGRDSTELRRRNEGPGIGLLVAASLPTGDDDSFTGEGQATFDLQLSADFHLLGAGGGVMLGWRARPYDRRIGDTVFRDQLLFGLGIKVPIPVLDGLSALAEIHGALDARDPFGGGARSAIEGSLGFRFTHEHLTYTTAVGTGFTDGVGTPAVRAIFGIQWAPRMPDADNDGIADSVDECPFLPEDMDGFQDEDGCSDPDNDNDFIPDVDDRCPNEEALEGRDENEDGCTDPEPATPTLPPPATEDPTETEPPAETEAQTEVETETETEAETGTEAEPETETETGTQTAEPETGEAEAEAD